MYLQKKILIFRNCSLGDFIVGIPSYKAIKELNDDCKIYFLSLYNNDIASIKPSEISLKIKIIDKFIFFQKLRINNFLKLIKFIKKFKFYKLYYLNENKSIFKTLRDYIFFKFCNINKLEGFDFYKLLKIYFNCIKGEMEMHNLLSRTKVALSKKKLDEYYFNSLSYSKFYYKKKYITLSFGGRLKKKQWNDNNWILLIKKIITHFSNINIYLIGSSKESRFANQLQKLYPKNIKNFCFNCKIKNKVSIIAESSFHISHDDGTMHVASTFKKNNICIFSAIYPYRMWFPYNPNAIILWPKNNGNINSINHVQVFNKFFMTCKKYKICF